MSIKGSPRKYVEIIRTVADRLAIGNISLGQDVDELLMGYMEWLKDNFDENHIQIIKPTKLRPNKKSGLPETLKKGCPLCYKKSDQLVNDGYCVCIMDSYINRFARRYNLDPMDKPHRFHRFCGNSWLARRNTYLKKNNLSDFEVLP